MGKRRPDAGWFDIVIYHMISLFFFLLGRIPRKTAFRLTDCIGRLWFAFDWRHRAVAIENLSMVYGDRMPPAEIRRLARRVFCNLTMIAYEIGWAMSVDTERLVKHFRFYGMHHLHDARKKGKGVLVLTGHIGNWELLLVMAAIMNMRFSAVYRPLDFKPLDMFFEDIRNTTGTKLHPKKGAILKVLRSLRNKEGMGILLDQNTKAASGVIVNFLGRPANTHYGLAVLAKRSGAPVIPAFVVREEGCYSLRILPEVPLVQTGDEELDIMQNTRLYNRVLESVIMAYPEQWFWIHKRWKLRPDRKEKYKKKKRA